MDAMIISSITAGLTWCDMVFRKGDLNPSPSPIASSPLMSWPSHQDGNHVVGDYGWRGSATLTYSITWRPFPQPSRLKGGPVGLS